MFAAGVRTYSTWKSG